MELIPYSSARRVYKEDPLLRTSEIVDVVTSLQMEQKFCTENVENKILGCDGSKGEIDYTNQVDIIMDKVNNLFNELTISFNERRDKWLIEDKSRLNDNLIKYIELAMGKTGNVIKCMSDLIYGENLKFKCQRDKGVCKPHISNLTMAYVNSSNTIHMCDLFFDLPESCNSYPKKKQGRQHHDNLAGVLLHEISHRCETSDDFYFERVNSEASLECKDYFSNLLFGKSSQEITQDEKDESKIKNPNSISHFPNAITFISPSSKKVTSIEELKKVPNSSFTWGHLADSYYFWSIYGFCIPDLNECPEYN